MAKPLDRAAGAAKQKKKTAAKLEAKGIIVIAIVILIFILARFWHNIPWNLR